MLGESTLSHGHPALTPARPAGERPDQYRLHLAHVLNSQLICHFLQMRLGLAGKMHHVCNYLFNACFFLQLQEEYDHIYLVMESVDILVRTKVLDPVACAQISVLSLGRR